MAQRRALTAEETAFAKQRALEFSKEYGISYADAYAMVVDGMSQMPPGVSAQTPRKTTAVGPVGGFAGGAVDEVLRRLKEFLKKPLPERETGYGVKNWPTPKELPRR